MKSGDWAIRLLICIFFKTSKIRDCRVQSVVKSFQSLFLTPKPKFHRLRNQMNSSRNKNSRKNYFPSFNSFPSAMSHIRKSTKMRFPGIRPKMAQLHKNTTSSKMVARGWYMTHFDRRDLLNSKKLGWDGFHNLSDLHEPICVFFSI